MAVPAAQQRHDAAPVRPSPCPIKLQVRVRRVRVRVRGPAVRPSVRRRAAFRRNNERTRAAQKHVPQPAGTAAWG